MAMVKGAREEEWGELALAKEEALAKEAAEALAEEKALMGVASLCGIPHRLTHYCMCSSTCIP